MAMVVGCSTGPSFEVGPELAANPNPSVPLAAVVRFTANEPVSTGIDVSDGVNAWTLDYGEAHDPAQGLGVIGMRPDRDHEILVTIRNAAGEETTAEPLTFRTPPLPEVGIEFPPVEVTMSRADRMEPGVTLFNPRRRRVGLGPEIAAFNAGFGMLMVLDHAGEVTWYYRVDSRVSDFEKVANGNLIFVTADFRMIEIDWLGNTVNQWYAANRPEGPAEGIAVDTQTFHHEIDELPNGNIIVLSSEWREIDDYYTDETETYSRAVEYEIDEENMRVRQLWQSEQEGPDSVVSIAMGDVDWLPETENILVAYGAILDPDTIDQVDWPSDSRLQFNQWTRLREYVRSDPPEVVYEVVLDTGTDDMGWTLFGAERIDRVGP